MRKRKVTYRPGKAQGIFGIVWGCVFILIGLVVVVPAAGAFGLLWTAMAVGITAMNAYQSFGKKYRGPVLKPLKELKKMLDRISLILVVIGAINWGSIGLFKFDIVAWICGGQGAILSRIIYTVVALAGIWCLSLLFRENEVLEVHNGEQ